MKNTLTWIVKILLGLSGLMLIFVGFQWGVMPKVNFETYNVTIESIAGRSMVQTDISAPLIAGGIFLVLFIIKGNKWFLPLFIFVTSYIVVRALTLFIIGFDNGALFGVVFETIVLALIFALKKLRE